MDFTSNNRDGFYDEQDRSTTHFPFSSPPSVSSSSSPQYRGFFPLVSNDSGRTEEDQEMAALASPPPAASSSTGGGHVAAIVIKKEHMFDKVVTPSDVGKLNRLVIPKQHAEKYFPLDTTANEKGLLLNFEDCSGKPWRFRYSYWNSSQSYVMTKGWSRFVKEKKLDAGDIVSFQRGLGEEAKDRLFIDWRRRQNSPQFDHHHQYQYHQHSTSSGFGLHRSNVQWSPLLLRSPPGSVVQYPHHQPNNYINSYHPSALAPNQNSYSHYYYNNNSNNVNPSPGSIVYLRSASATQVQESGGNIYGHSENRNIVDHVEPMVYDSVPVAHGSTTTKSEAKKLRLFGVNMECGVSAETSLQEKEESNEVSETSNIPFTRLYNGLPVQTDNHQFLMINKGKSSSSMSLDLDI